MKKLKIKNLILLLTINFLLLITLLPVFANQEECQVGGIFKLANLSEDCVCRGRCGLNDFLKLAAGVTKLLTMVVSGIVLTRFIAGGIVWLTSAGNPEKVKKGQGILISSLIGLIIVLFAWQIVNLVICALSQGKIEDTCKIFGNQKWNVFPH